MNKNHLLKIESLTQLHSAFGLDKPLHPLISLVKLEDVKIIPGTLPELLVLNFYNVLNKLNFRGFISLIFIFSIASMIASQFSVA